MQRDIDILRLLLLAIEQGNAPLYIESEPRATAHIHMAVDAGLLSGMEMGGGARKHYPIPSLTLTPAGYEFVSLARNDAIWDRAAARIAERVGTTSFGIWLGLLTAEHKKALDDGA